MVRRDPVQPYGSPSTPLGGTELVLAFVATGSRRLDHDPLAASEGFGAWMGAAGLAEGPEALATLAAPSRARTLVGESLALRRALGRLFEVTRSGAPHPPDALFALNRVLAAGACTSRLEPEAGGGWALVELEGGEPPLSLLAPIARAAAELLVSVDPRRLRACDAPGCGTWFVDTSKGGRRRWCSMASCGNRHKAARHRRRRAGGR